VRCIHVATICMAAAGCQTADQRTDESPQPGAASTTVEPRIACNLDGLTPAERAESQKLLLQLGSAVVRNTELATGYALRLDEERMGLAALSRWVDLERRCCPFFHFDIEVMPAGGGTWLRLTGGAGVKDFIRSELATGGGRS
jgi:hypothetical protein